MALNNKEWDLFISHASEDKESLVRPLAKSLAALGLKVWYDEFTLQLGDSLSKSIDIGIANSLYGLVVISTHFISKKWPEYELRGLVTREIHEDAFIIPLWHGVSKKQVIKFSPSLADKIAIISSELTATEIALKILRKVRPDIYQKYPRTELEQIASGEYIKDLQKELERAKEELSEYQCPYCKAPLITSISAPIDPQEKHWDVRNIYQCGYTSFGSTIEIPCPNKSCK